MKRSVERNEKKNTKSGPCLEISCATIFQPRIPAHLIWCILQTLNTTRHLIYESYPCVCARVCFTYTHTHLHTRFFLLYIYIYISQKITSEICDDSSAIGFSDHCGLRHHFRASWRTNHTTRVWTFGLQAPRCRGRVSHGYHMGMGQNRWNCHRWYHQ